MNILLLLYSLAGTVLFLALFPFFLVYVLATGKHREGLANRLGIYRGMDGRRTSKTVCLWVHAASVGEVSAAAPIIAALAAAVPDARIVLSTTTESGQAAARKVLGGGGTCVYAPLDLPFAAALGLQTIKPDILVCVETEIWPNWLCLAHWRGIRTVFVNGRISVRSIKGYRRVRALMQPVLATVDAFSMIHARDARRLASLGVSSDKIEVNGNTKYDRLSGLATPETKQAAARLYNMNGDAPVLVAGSLRRGEEALLLEAYRAVRKMVPDLLCIIAPRHTHRAKKIAERARALGFDVQMRSGLGAAGGRRQAPLVILDTLGELSATYGVASVVFCGGSLVPLGGQNVLEAAAWGKPVLFGPWMDDFQTEKELLLASGGGSEVADERELVGKIKFYLANPGTAREAGRAGRAVITANTGAGCRHAAVITDLLAGRRSVTLAGDQ